MSTTEQPVIATGSSHAQAEGIHQDFAIVPIFTGVSAAIGLIKGFIDLVTSLQSARSVVVEIDNNTDLPLTRTGENLVHGGYAKDPDHSVAPHQASVLGGVSRGLFTGTEGYVDWAAGPVTLRIHWDNPYAGINSASVQLLGPDAGHYIAFATAGAGNTGAQMRFELFRSGSDFAGWQPPPAQMDPGQVVPVSVTMKNTGLYPWTSDARFALGSQNPQDNSLWGLGRVGLPHDVAPGETVTFQFNATAPAKSGYYNFAWRVVQDGVTWLGDFTPSNRVQVGNPKSKDTKEKDHHKESQFNKDLADNVYYPSARVPQGLVATSDDNDGGVREDETAAFIRPDEHN